MRSELNEQPLVRAEILTFLAKMYDRLDNDDRALELIEQAFESLDGPRTEQLAQALLIQGQILVGRTDDEAGLAALDRALPMLLEFRRDADAAEAMDLMSIVRNRQNKVDDATRLTRDALAIRLRVLGEYHTDVASSYNNLGVLSRTQGDYPAARRYYEKALQIRRQVLPDDHPQIATTLNNIGALENVDGNYIRAADVFKESLAINRRVNGEAHHDTIAALNNYGFMLLRLGHPSDARDALTQVYDYWVGQGKADHPNALVTRVNLAAVQRVSGDSTGALLEFETLEESLATTLGHEHPFVAVALHHQARCLLDLGRLDAARERIERALQLRQASFGADHPDSADLIRDQALIAFLQNDFDAAESLGTRALDLQRSKLPANHPSISMSEILLGRIARVAGNVPRSLQLQQAALDNLARIYTIDFPDLTEAHFQLGKSLLADHRAGDAERHLRLARESLAKRYGPLSWQVAEVEVSLGDAILEQGRVSVGAIMRAEALGRINSVLPEYHPVRQYINAGHEL